MTECFRDECGKIHGNALDIVSERRIRPVHHSCSSNQRLKNMMLGTEEICCIINLGALLKNKYFLLWKNKNDLDKILFSQRRCGIHRWMYLSYLFQSLSPVKMISRKVTRLTWGPFLTAFCESRNNLSESNLYLM